MSYSCFSLLLAGQYKDNSFARFRPLFWKKEYLLSIIIQNRHLKVTYWIFIKSRSILPCIKAEKKLKNNVSTLLNPNLPAFFGVHAVDSFYNMRNTPCMRHDDTTQPPRARTAWLWRFFSYIIICHASVSVQCLNCGMRQKYFEPTTGRQHLCIQNGHFCDVAVLQLWTTWFLCPATKWLGHIVLARSVIPSLRPSLIPSSFTFRSQSQQLLHTFNIHV